MCKWVGWLVGVQKGRWLVWQHSMRELNGFQWMEPLVLRCFCVWCVTRDLLPQDSLENTFYK